MPSMLISLVFLIMVGLPTQVRDKGEPNWNIPREVSRRFQKEGFLSHYEVSTLLNPFYLRGDFDGDGVPDYAVLVINRATKIMGIAVIRGHARTVEILGAGGISLKMAATEDGSPPTAIDSFEWMDSWHVGRKQPLKFTGLDTPVTPMTGEGIVVEKAEASSALIYRDGKQYRWLQLSD
jgi:hypothetical protein